MNIDLSSSRMKPDSYSGVKVIRHAEVCRKLGISAASLFDMIAKDQFPKPFPIIPGGRSVGWLEGEVDAWIIDRRAKVREGVACSGQ